MCSQCGKCFWRKESPKESDIRPKKGFIKKGFIIVIDIAIRASQCFVNTHHMQILGTVEV